MAGELDRTGQAVIHAVRSAAGQSPGRLAVASKVQTMYGIAEGKDPIIGVRDCCFLDVEILMEVISPA